MWRLERRGNFIILCICSGYIVLYLYMYCCAADQHNVWNQLCFDEIYSHIAETWQLKM